MQAVSMMLKWLSPVNFNVGVADGFGNSAGKIKQFVSGYELLGAPGVLEHGMYQKFIDERGRSYKLCKEAVLTNKYNSEEVGMVYRKSDGS